MKYPCCLLCYVDIIHVLGGFVAVDIEYVGRTRTAGQHEDRCWGPDHHGLAGERYAPAEDVVRRAIGGAEDDVFGWWYRLQSRHLRASASFRPNPTGYVAGYVRRLPPAHPGLPASGMREIEPAGGATLCT